MRRRRHGRRVVPVGMLPLPKLPVIVVSNRPLRDMTADAFAALVAANDPPQLVYAPAPGLVIPPVPEAPSGTEVKEALATACDIMAEFPFADTASAANALALLLTPIMRPSIAGPVPLALLDKPKRGTGATL